MELGRQFSFLDCLVQPATYILQAIIRAATRVAMNSHDAQQRIAKRQNRVRVEAFAAELRLPVSSNLMILGAFDPKRDAIPSSYCPGKLLTARKKSFGMFFKLAHVRKRKIHDLDAQVDGINDPPCVMGFTVDS